MVGILTVWVSEQSDIFGGILTFPAMIIQSTQFQMKISIIVGKKRRYVFFSEVLSTLDSSTTHPHQVNKLMGVSEGINSFKEGVQTNRRSGTNLEKLCG